VDGDRGVRGREKSERVEEGVGIRGGAGGEAEVRDGGMGRVETGSPKGLVFVG